MNALTVSALVDVMEEFAPTRHAESWDNVGLLVGDPAAPLTKVLLTIDYTAEVAGEAARERCDALVAYHPPIFKELKRVAAGSLVFDAIRRGLSIYSPHTALDVAEGGTNDMLADAIGLADRGPLRFAATKGRHHKLVTFVPEKDLETVSRALFDAGCGQIGRYSSCSFRTGGTGTFFGEEGTDPAVGERGRLVTSPEVKIETILPVEKVEAVVKALRRAHPYEEPAFDLVALAAPPEGRGMGRVGSFAEPTERRILVERVKRELGIDRLLVAGPTDGLARRAAVCAGACGDLLDDALAARADVYLTGEMRHHDALKAARAGMTVLCTLHSNSERAVLRRVKRRIEERLPGLPVVVSAADRDPFVVQ